MESTPINVLVLSLRTLNALKRAQVHTVEQVLGMSDGELLSIRNLGVKSLEELKRGLAEHGFNNED